MTNAQEPDARLSTTISRKWSLKIFIFAALTLGLGVWGLYDAMVAYPNRGRHAAEYLEGQYLQAYKDVNGTIDRGASIEDPKAELARLRQAKRDDSPMSAIEVAKYRWLEQLSYVSRLDPSSSTIPRTDTFPKGVSKGGAITSGLERLVALQTGITTPAKPLEGYDIPSQWLIMACGLGVAAYLGVLLARVFSTKYHFEPAAQRLHLPGGATVVPGDIDEFDKRKWDKFLITLRTKADHPTLGGKPLTLDLLRHEPLEEWVLQMEKTRFPEAAQESAAASS